MRHLSACLALCTLLACRPEDAARSYWDAVRTAPTDADRVAAARALAPLSTPEVAARILDHAGDFEKSEARDLLLAIVARHRPEGVRWLARRLLGSSLDEAYAVVFHAPSEDEEILPSPPDDPLLVDALTTVFPDDPQAGRWLALMALGLDGAAAERVGEAVSAGDPARTMVREALESRDLPQLWPSALFVAFGAPRDEAEEALLRRRYRTAFAASLGRGDVCDFSAYDELATTFAEAFPEEETPVDPGERRIVAFLRDLPAPPDPDAPDTFRGPELAETLDFLSRHDRSGWAPVLRTYAEWNALPSNALALVCRASASECADALGEHLDPHPAAADLAPALDLPGGDGTLAVACDALEPAEARQLAMRAAAAGMPLEVRESAADCLAVLGDPAETLVRSVLVDALAAQRFDVAGRLGMNFHEAVTEAEEAAALRAFDRGRVPAEEIEGLLLDDDRALAIRRDVAVRREAERRGRGGGGTRRVIVLDDLVFD